MKGQADKFASATIRKAIEGRITARKATTEPRIAERHLRELRRSRAGFEYRRLPKTLPTDRNSKHCQHSADKAISNINADQSLRC